MTYDNSGLISRNQRKREGKQDADWTGKITVNGIDYWINGWEKDGQYGPFISLSVRPKVDQPEKPAPPAFDDDLPF